MNKTYLITVACGNMHFGNVVQEVKLPFNLEAVLTEACKSLKYPYEESIIVGMVDVTYEAK